MRTVVELTADKDMRSIWLDSDKTSHKLLASY
jgi:hypothetical protein